MLYKCGNYAISIKQIDGFGMKPGLWVFNGNTNTFVKVATFISVEKTEEFRQYLEYLLFPDSKEPKEIDENE